MHPVNKGQNQRTKLMERNVKGIPEERIEMGDGCYENESATLGDKPLAYAYVPVQRWRMLYDPDKGLSRGTIFEELDMPMEVYGNE